MSLPTIKQPVPRLDITIKKGADFRLSLCIIERDEDGNAVVVDTTGWIVRFYVREEPKVTSPTILAADLGGGITVGIQGEPGEETNVDIVIPASRTITVAHEGKAGYDMLVVYPDGSQEYLLEGRAFLQPSYTWWSV